MIETILGGLVGGAFRLFPEILKWVDRRGERKHELSMQDKQLEFQKLLDGRKIEEANVSYDTAAVDALKEAIKGQETPSGVRWIDGLTSSVRPVVTYWFMLLYCVAKIAVFVTGINAGSPWIDAISLAWTEADQALWAGILNFWFLSRVFEKNRI